MDNNILLLGLLRVLLLRNRLAYYIFINSNHGQFFTDTDRHK